MSPLVHHKENVADIYTNAACQLGVEEDVGGKAVPVAIEGEADEAVLAVEDR